MQLKTLLREYLEERHQSSAPRYDFLPGYARSNQLPVFVEKSPWTQADVCERTLQFDRRSDLQDFVNCYLELEEEVGIYTSVSIEGMSLTIRSKDPLPSRFKQMIDEIANETRGH